MLAPLTYKGPFDIVQKIVEINIYNLKIINENYDLL